MKKSVILLIFILFVLPVFSFAQSLEDLQQLQQLKRELEKTGQLAVPKKISSDSLKAKSLQVFKDQTSAPPPIIKKDSGVQAEAKSESVKKTVQKQLPRFGFDVFKNARVDFSPEIYGPVDDKYPLGPGDNIVISVWGEVELRQELTINREGQIYIDNVGLISLSGLNIRQAKKKLAKVMGKSYSSILKGKAFLDVSVGKLRSIRMFVIGDVVAPGVFTVPALTAPFNMLFYAGGVKTGGSLRNIKLIRNNKVIKTLDFYDFLLHGEDFSNIRLQTRDVLLIPGAKKLVYLSGAVKKEAVYELTGKEGLKDLISISGGFTEKAYIDALQIERFVDNKNKELITVNYRQLLKEGKEFPLQNGDRIIVERINRELKNYVNLQGPVYGPKKFEFYPGMTIKDLFAQVDSIAGDAYLERVQITRTLPDKKQQLFSVNLKDILESAEQDFPLAPEDRITIQSVQTLFPQDSVRIFGAVNNPGKYLLKKDMSLKDLIFTAGGFRKDAVIKEAEVSRINPNKTGPHQLANIIYVNIDSNYTKDIQPQKADLFFLEPNDNIFIRANSDWELQRNVSIEGEVVKPGIYTLKSKTERITDIIQRAGGLKQTAYLEGATIKRYQNGVGQIGIDFKKIFANPQNEENIYLQNGDRIVIPERLATVKVVGGVNFPSSVLFEKGKGLEYYIEATGGFIELADKKNVTIRLANGRPVRQKRFLFWKYLPEDITAGSTIYVPVLSEKKGIDWSGTIRDAAAILSSVATMILIYDRIQGN